MAVGKPESDPFYTDVARQAYRMALRLDDAAILTQGGLLQSYRGCFGRVRRQLERLSDQEKRDLGDESFHYYEVAHLMDRLRTTCDIDEARRFVADICRYYCDHGRSLFQ